VSPTGRKRLRFYRPGPPGTSLFDLAESPESRKKGVAQAVLSFIAGVRFDL
jgi:hypothetical protein